MIRKTAVIIHLIIFFPLFAGAENISGPSSGTERPAMSSPSYPYPRLPYKELIFPKGLLPSPHSPSIVALPNGGLFAVWYASAGGSSETAIWGSRRPGGSRGWTAPSVISHTPGHPNKNPALYLRQDDKLLLFWTEEERWFRWKRDKVRMKVSEDLGRTWGPARGIETSSGFLTRTHPLKLHSGRLLLPVYMDWNTSSAVMISDDDGMAWNKPRFMLFLFGTQPTVIQRSDQSLFALMRSGMWPRLAWQAVSYNLGNNWKDSKTSGVRNPGSSLEMLKLENGHVVLVFNDSKEERDSISIALSYDEGRTWAHTRLIDSLPGRVNMYPSVVQDRRGLIHVVYAYCDRQSIAHFVTDENWIAGR